VPRRKPKPHELSTEDAMRKLFPLKVRETVRVEAEKARKPEESPTIRRKPT
jgi:hypothetical protein